MFYTPLRKHIVVSVMLHTVISSLKAAAEESQIKLYHKPSQYKPYLSKQKNM